MQSIIEFLMFTSTSTKNLNYSVKSYIYNGENPFERLTKPF